MRVVVTGGGSGLGLAVAQAFLAAGAEVHVGEISPETLEVALQANPGLTGTATDVGSSEAVERLAGEALEQMGGIDVLVNNAGVGGTRGAIEDIDPAEWGRVMRTNVDGIFHTARWFVPTMKRQHAGCILNISTTSVRTGLPLRTPYVVSKSAVLGFTKNLARELGPYNIRCNAILPGSVENARGDRLLEERAAREGITASEALKQRLRYISLRTRIQPSDVAEAAVFLASPGARHISGQFLGVCGNVEWEE